MNKNEIKFEMMKVGNNIRHKWVKETKSATMNIFHKKKIFYFKSFVKGEFSYVFTINLKLHGKVNYLIKQVCFSLVALQ